MLTLAFAETERVSSPLVLCATDTFKLCVCVFHVHIICETEEREREFSVIVVSIFYIVFTTSVIWFTEQQWQQQNMKPSSVSS